MGHLKIYSQCALLRILPLSQPRILTQMVTNIN